MLGSSIEVKTSVEFICELSRLSISRAKFLHCWHVFLNCFFWTQDCPVCLTNGKNLAFGCGHMVRCTNSLYFALRQIAFVWSQEMIKWLQTCRDCGSRVSNCPICRLPITSRLRLYTWCCSWCNYLTGYVLHLLLSYLLSMVCQDIKFWNGVSYSVNIMKCKALSKRVVYW